MMRGLKAGPASIYIKMTEPWVTLEVGGKFTDFLMDTGATYSVLIQNSGPTCPSNHKIVDTGWETKSCLGTMPLTCKYKTHLVVMFFWSFHLVPLHHLDET